MKIQLNSVKTQTNFSIDFQEVNTRSYVWWGSNNLAPYALRDIVDNSPTLKAIISRSQEFTKGNDITIESNTDIDYDIVSAIIDDLWYYNGFALKIYFTPLGDVANIRYVDFRNIRVDKDFQYAYELEIHNGIIRTNPKKYKLFESIDKVGDADVQILYYKTNLFTNIYPTPTYNSVLRQAATEAQIGDFHYNTILNNFMANAIINFNNGIPDEETSRIIEQRLNDKFTGSKNSARLLVSFNDSKEQAVTIERIQDDNFDKKYTVLSNDIRKSIFVAMGAIPALFGDAESKGFNSVEFQDTFKLYNRTSIKPKQDIIKNQLKKLNVYAQFVPFTLE